MKAKRIRYRYKSSAQLKRFRTVITDENRNHFNLPKNGYRIDDFQIGLLKLDLGLPEDIDTHWIRDIIKMQELCPNFLKDFLTVGETEKSIIYHSLAAKDCLRNEAT